MLLILLIRNAENSNSIITALNSATVFSIFGHVTCPANSNMWAIISVDCATSSYLIVENFQKLWTDPDSRYMGASLIYHPLNCNM